MASLFEHPHPSRSWAVSLISVVASVLAVSAPCSASPFFFSTGNVDGLVATASRPDTGGVLEIESADDFLLANRTTLTQATFIGLLPSGFPLANIAQVVIEIYRVFPLDSDVTRTSGAPTFSTPNVPTRVNSPSDVEFVGRDSDVSGDLSFTAQVLAASFTAANSVVNGINPTPNQLTHGEGPVTGEEVQFNISFLNPITLPADHYFFVPQVSLTDGQNFLWLSATRPLVAPGTPFAPDLQSWIRNENLAPDWLRVGTDIVGGTTFNAAFTLTGVVSEPGSLLLVALAFLGMAAGQRRRSTAR